MANNTFDISEQLDHIAYMFNNRTKGKAYENFIINAIYTKIDNHNLIPITQQYVKNPNDPRRYYLIDLYFPQLNYGIEIDERHHLQHQKEDEKRSDDLKNAIECEVYRISIFNSENKKRTYSDIYQDIDKVVQIINQKIKDIDGDLKWETNEDRKKKVIERGFFDVKDDVSYSGITDIYNICGGKRGKKKEDAKKLGRAYYKLNRLYKLWVPKLAIMIDGKEPKYQNGYKNILSEDYTTITEIAEKPWNNPTKDKNYLRVVFMQMKDRFGKRCVKFIGIFKMDVTEEQNAQQNQRCYRRVDTNVKISELK